LALTPVIYEQVLELTRQQLVLRHGQDRSPQYGKLLADLEVSIAEWHDWRERHPGPGTITALRAQARWLAPLFATVANPLLLASPWLFGVIATANRTGPDLAALYESWAVRITLRAVRKDGGVKRRS
jgi:hypothetical protein